MSDWAPARIGALPVVRTVAELRRMVDAWHRAGETVALVPTLGALHRGHLALVEHGRRVANRTVASIFVNPTQFSPSEDFARYPRDEAGDAAKLSGAKCDLLYAPDVAEMYPEGFSTTVTAGAIAEGQDGRSRPHHFPGVATVVTKLLLQARADVACFGEKDYQQLQVVRHAARDLDIPTRIDGVATVREPDGLALSSRNLYLTPAERAIAPALHKVLLQVVERIEGGAADVQTATAEGLATLTRAGFERIDYLEVADAETLTPLAAADRPGRVLAAAWLGRTRLIDNVALGVRRGG